MFSIEEVERIMDETQEGIEKQQVSFSLLWICFYLVQIKKLLNKYLWKML